MTTPSSTPPGWYDDQSSTGVLRYWDGNAWTEQTKPATGDFLAQPTTATEVAAKPKRPWYRRKAIVIPVGIVGGIILISAISSAMNPTPQASFQKGFEAAASPSTTPEQTPAPVDTTVGVPNMQSMTVADAKKAAATAGVTLGLPDGAGDDWTVSGQNPAANSRVEKGSPVTVQADAPKPKLTVSQEQAVSKAQSYLSFTSFSRQGLIDQLAFDQFSAADATFAVDSLNVDWNAQAVAKAKSYLEFTSFSRNGLIDQLVFDKFTREQAAAGADGVGLH